MQQAYILFTFGLSMVVLLAVLIVFYYSRRRKDDVEAPKYKMLDDD